MVKWRSLLAGAVVSAVCLWLLLRTVDLAGVANAFAHARPEWVLLALLTIAASMTMRFWRWQLLFLPHDRVSFSGVASATLIGYMLNTVLPGRVGELARAALVSQSDGVSTARAFGTIIVEKILDVIVLLLLLGGLLPFLPPLPEVSLGGRSVRIDPAAVGANAAVLFGAFAVVFFVACRFRAPVIAWLRQHVDPLLRGRVSIASFAELVLGSADSLAVPHLLALHLIAAPLMWLLAFLQVYCVERAFGLQVPLAAPGLVLAMTNLGMTIPSAPGYVGVYHAIAVVALTPFGVDRDAATAFAFTLHALGFGSFLVAGTALLMIGLGRQSYSLSDLWRWRAATPMGAGSGPQDTPAAPRAAHAPSPVGAPRTALRTEP